MKFVFVVNSIKHLEASAKAGAHDWLISYIDLANSKRGTGTFQTVKQLKFKQGWQEREQ